MPEVAVAVASPSILRVIRLLEALDSLSGHTTANLDRVSGGSPVPAAERRLELIEALEKCPPRLRNIADALRGQPSGSARGRYVDGLLQGLSGRELMRRARLSKKSMAENRAWLKTLI